MLIKHKAVKIIVLIAVLLQFCMVVKGQMSFEELSFSGLDKAYRHLPKTYVDSVAIGLSDNEQALKYYAEALKQLQENDMQNDDQYVLTLSALAISYKNIGNMVNAQMFIDKALGIIEGVHGEAVKRPIAYHVLSNASQIYASSGKEKQALAYCDMLQALPTNDAEDEALMNRARCIRVCTLLRFGRYDEAQKILKLINPNYFDVINSWDIPFYTKLFVGDSDCLTYLQKEQDRLRSNIKSMPQYSMQALANCWETNAGDLNAFFSEALYWFRTPKMRIRAFNNLQLTKNFQVYFANSLRELGYKESLPQQETIFSKAIGKAFSSVSDFQKIQSRLGDNEIVVEFMVVKNRLDCQHVINRYGAFIIRKGDEAPVFVDICPCESLDGTAYNELISDAVDYAQNMYSLKDSRLYDILWKPLSPYLKYNSTLFVSKARELNYINFSALSDGRKRLADLYRIHDVVSASAIFSDSVDEEEMYSSAFLCGDIDYDALLDELPVNANRERPELSASAYRSIEDRGRLGRLQSSRAEIFEIKDVVGSEVLDVVVLCGKDATEERIKGLSGHSPDIMHLSTHGFYYRPSLNKILISGRAASSDVYFSDGSGRRKDGSLLKYNGLFFSGANNAWNLNKYRDGVDDGVLTGDEISDLDFSNTRLVVLSACQTGLGDVSDVDGNMGLIKSFKMAGVRRIISTLWNVADQATAVFMEEFYRQLMAVRNIYKAFRNTVDNFRLSGSAYANPYYWAGFVLTE